MSDGIGDPAGLFGDMVAALMRRSEMPQIDDPIPFLGSDDARRYPAAFLIALCGGTHPHAGTAHSVLREPGAIPSFFRSAVLNIRDELRTVVADNPDLQDALTTACTIPGVGDAGEAQDKVWAVTFPEGVGVAASWADHGSALKKRRQFQLVRPNPAPLTDPISSMLVTANVLVSSPGNADDPDFWFDHPIPLDAAPAATEIAHGLRSLDSAVAFELKRHPEWRGPLSVVLSVSTTRRGSETAARDLVRSALAAIGPLPNLRVFAFDELRARRLWDTAISPELEAEAPSNVVFGVAGSYGRHYSFLKAIAALWAVCIDGSIRATFKIDLDQSFPQEALVEETGQSAFEHFTTPHWGASAIGSDGSHVDMALLAGGLVNAADLETSLFTPDVVPGVPVTPEDAIFFSRLPQALSTEFEIGATSAIERVHVTGGTNGILVDGLRRWRLFTPSVVGRAEDQAYLLSGLGDLSNRPGYVHEPGLVMRHDKADLIPEVIEASEGSKHIGDLLRMRFFSAYAKANLKAILDPFSGCFVSSLPITVTGLRFALRALRCGSSEAAAGYLSVGSKRLDEVARTVAGLDGTVRSEHDGWEAFYDVLDRVELGLSRGDERFADLAAAARAVVSEAELTR